MNTQSTTKSLQQIHLAVLLFSLAGPIGKMVSLQPTLIVFWRVFFAGLFLTVILKALRIDFGLESKPKRDVLSLMALGVLLLFHWILFFQSIKVSTVAVGLLGYSTFPVFASLLEPFFFKEKISARDVLLAVIAFVGVVTIVPSFDISNHIVPGVLWGISSGFTFALLSIGNRRYARKYPGLLIAWYETMTAAIFLWGALFFIPSQLNGRDLLLLAFLGIVSTAVAHTLFIGGMRNVKARSASVIATLEPVYGILFALLLLKEVPSKRTIIGGILIVGAAALASRSEKSKAATISEISR